MIPRLSKIAAHPTFKAGLRFGKMAAMAAAIVTASLTATNYLVADQRVPFLNNLGSVYGPKMTEIRNTIIVPNLEVIKGFEGPLEYADFLLAEIQKHSLVAEVLDVLSFADQMADCRQSLFCRVSNNTATEAYIRNAYFMFEPFVGYARENYSGRDFARSLEAVALELREEYG